MNRHEHMGTAFICYFLLGGLFLLLDINFLWSYSFMVFVGVVVPDILEPPVDWTHRGFFHSKRMFKILGMITLCLSLWGILFHALFYLVFLKIGYLLHLLGDATTYVGLPA